MSTNFGIVEFSRHKVVTKEYERGWGQRVISTIYYDSKENALNAVQRVNQDNTALVVPDWFMQAEYIYLGD
jgi:hypothetical protein